MFQRGNSRSECSHNQKLFLAIFLLLLHRILYLFLSLQKLGMEIDFKFKWNSKRVWLLPAGQSTREVDISTIGFVLQLSMKSFTAPSYDVTFLYATTETINSTIVIATVDHPKKYRQNYSWENRCFDKRLFGVLKIHFI